MQTRYAKASAAGRAGALPRRAADLFDLFAVRGQKSASRALERRSGFEISGGYVIFRDQTEALTTVDVERRRVCVRRVLRKTLPVVRRISDKSRSGTRSHLRSAASRLPDLGGIIIVDFIDMDTLEFYLARCSPDSTKALVRDRA